MSSCTYMRALPTYVGVSFYLPEKKHSRTRQQKTDGGCTYLIAYQFVGSTLRYKVDNLRLL